ADDRHRHAIQQDRFTDHISRASESPGPKAVADDNDRTVGACSVIRFLNGAAKLWAHLERREIIARDHFGGHWLGLPGNRSHHLIERLKREHGRKEVIILPQTLIDRIIK